MNNSIPSDLGSLPHPPPGLSSLSYSSNANPGSISDVNNPYRSESSRLERYAAIDRNYFPRPEGSDPLIDDNGSSSNTSTNFVGFSTAQIMKDNKLKEEVSNLSSDYDLQRGQFSSYVIIPPSSNGTPLGRNKNAVNSFSNNSYSDISNHVGVGNSNNNYYGNSTASHNFRNEEAPPSTARVSFAQSYNFSGGYYGPGNSNVTSMPYGNDLQELDNSNPGGQYSSRLSQPQLLMQQQQQQQQQLYQPGKGLVSYGAMDEAAHLSSKPPLPYLQPQYKQQQNQQLQQQNYPGNAMQSRNTTQFLYGNSREGLTGGSSLPSPSNRSLSNQGPYTGFQPPGMGANGMNPYSPKHAQNSGTGGSNAQGRAINKMLLDILRERVIDPQRLELAIETYTERMDCVNVATLLFHTGKKRLLLSPGYISRIANRLITLKEELRAREASNALYGLKCMSSDVPEVKELVLALANKLSTSTSEFLAQAVGNALYGCQMMTSDHEEVRQLLQVLATKVAQCSELLEAQNVGNALYGLRGMNSDHKEVRAVINALTPKIATAREDLNGQALGNSLYGLQSMSSKEPEVRSLLAVLATKVSRTWEELKAQEVGNALYGLKRMNTEVPEVRILISALVPKVGSSPEILDAQAIGNSFYGLQNMQSNSVEVLQLLHVMAQKVNLSCPELDGQAMGNSLYGLQGMSSDYPEVRAVVKALTTKLQTSTLDMNAQEMGNAIYGLQNMTSEHMEVRKLIAALTQKVIASKHELTSQEIGNAMFGLQGMSSSVFETRILVKQLALKIQQSHSVLDPQGVSNSLFGIQRMSSDCEEVRQLVQALANKIEHSWKLLGGQHLSNAMFGMQCLCSTEKEVRFLLQVLQGKIFSCRDELSAKQWSYAIFGLRNMNSDHGEVRNLVQAIAEKISVSSDTWTLQNLSMAMFGMQGMNSEADEVALLLNALANKSTVIDFTSGDREFNFKMLGNCIFGMQRMSTNSLNLCTILKYLPNVLSTIASYKMPLENQLFGSAICANILFGLQNCSCTNQSVNQLLRFVSQSIKSILANARKDVSNSSPRFVQMNDQSSFDELLSLYQSLALFLYAMTDLTSDSQLYGELCTHTNVLISLLEMRQNEFVSRTATIAETRLVQETAQKLSAEPYDVISGTLVFGFEMAVYISLNCSVPLITLAGTEWLPRLNIEVHGSSYSSPAKALFYRLRNGFLNLKHGVTVVSIPANSFRECWDAHGIGKIISGLRFNTTVFDALYPPTSNDAETITDTLRSMGKLQNPAGLMATVPPLIDYSSSFDSTGGVSSHGIARSHPLSVKGDQYAVDHIGSSEMGTFEYLDDDFNIGIVHSETTKRGAKVHNSHNNLKSRKPMGVYFGWLSAWPSVLFSGYCVSPLLHSNVLVVEPGNNKYPYKDSSRNAAQIPGDVNSPNASNGSNSVNSPYHNYNAKGFPTNKIDREPPIDESNVVTTPADIINDNKFRSSLNLSLNLSVLPPRDNQPLQTPSMPYRSHYEEEELLLQAQQSRIPTPVGINSSRLPAYSAYDHMAPFDSNTSRFPPGTVYHPRDNRPMGTIHSGYPSGTEMVPSSAQGKPSGGLARRKVGEDDVDDASSLGSGSVNKITSKYEKPDDAIVAHPRDDVINAMGSVSEEDAEAGGDDDNEIALLEAQLEVARLEAKLKLAKKLKAQKARGGGNAQDQAN